MNKINALKKWLRKNNLKREALLVSQADKLQKYAVSQGQISNLKEWFGDDYSKLSFNDLFGVSLRIVIPFDSEEQTELLNVVRTLKRAGWAPSGGNNYFHTKSVKQKLRRLDGGEEYEKEVEVAELKVSKEEAMIIPAGPRKGEEIISRKASSISKVLMNPKTNTPPGLADWWQNHQTEYAKDFNWKQIEAAFNDNQVLTKYSIIISRDPIDVLRMSDHETIRSCHSEGNSYFNCAVSESRGNGLVAYLVETEDLNRLLTPPSPWGSEPDAGKSSDKMKIKDLDMQEIFTDPQRNVRGIQPKSRVRLRKYVSENQGFEFAAPENRTYGPHPPGFVGRVRSWAWQSQKGIFDTEGDGEIELPVEGEMIMYGGSYRDSHDADILNPFFKEGGIEAQYYGNVSAISDDEDNTFDMWEREIEEVNRVADANLKNIDFYAEVDDDGEGNPYVRASANVLLSIPLYGWEDPYTEDNFIKTKSGFRPIPMGWYWNEFKGLLEHNEGGEIQDISLSGDKLEFHMTFECDDCQNPDDVSDFYDYVQRDIDSTYDSYVEMIRKRLVQNDYIAEIEFDKVADRLSSLELLAFDVYGDEEDNDGTILITSKPGFIPMNLHLSDHPISGSPDVVKIFNARSIDRNRYKLIDEPQAILSILDEMAKKAYEAAKRQLSFSFFKDSSKELFGYPEAINNFEIVLNKKYRGVSQRNDIIDDATIRVELKVSDSDEYILFIEKLVVLLDQNFGMIMSELKDLLIKKAKIYEEELKAFNETFYSGAPARPLIAELKQLPVDRIKRLALWIESNWDEFSNAEKYTAFHSYLIPAQRGYLHPYGEDLDAPMNWNNTVQRRPDTDVNYRWRGPSMKDIIIPSDSEVEDGDMAQAIEVEPTY